MPGTTFAVSTADWPNVRFAHSALFETMQAVRTLTSSRAAQSQRNWLQGIDRRAVLSQIPIVAALAGPGSLWVPDFLAPPPTRVGLTGLDEDLESVAHYPPRLVRRDLQRSLDSQPSPTRARVLQPLIEQPARARRAIVGQLRIAWEQLSAPHWPAITRLIADDIRHRSGQAARLGMGHMLDGLHPDIHAGSDCIVIDHSAEVGVDLGGRGLLLMPSAFLWPRVVIAHEDPWPPTLIYPARGVGNLWANPEPASGALAGVLGRSRARILLDLGVPRDTTSTAQRHQLSAATASVHLTKLAAAGLLAASRDGKQVWYQRSDLGTALVHAS